MVSLLTTSLPCRRCLGLQWGRWAYRLGLAGHSRQTYWLLNSQEFCGATNRLINESVSSPMLSTRIVKTAPTLLMTFTTTMTQSSTSSPRRSDKHHVARSTSHVTHLRASDKFRTCRTAIAYVIVVIVHLLAATTSSTVTDSQPSDKKINIRAAILLPGNNNRLFSIQKVGASFHSLMR